MPDPPGLGADFVLNEDLEKDVRTFIQIFRIFVLDMSPAMWGGPGPLALAALV
jgi:hypothetical protein